MMIKILNMIILGKIEVTDENGDAGENGASGDAGD